MIPRVQLFNCLQACFFYYGLQPVSLQKWAVMELFSSQLPFSPSQMAEKITRNPVKILVKDEEVTLDGIKQFYVDCGRRDFKLEVLYDLYEVKWLSSKERQLRLMFIQQEHQVLVNNSWRFLVCFRKEKFWKAYISHLPAGVKLLGLTGDRCLKFAFFFENCSLSLCLSLSLSLSFII